MRISTRLAFLALLVAAACRTGSAPHAAPVRLRVMAYTIRHGQGMDGAIDLDRVAAVIRSAAPDVVALQEVDAACARSGGVEQAEALAEKLGMQAAFGPFMPYDGGRYGMAVLSRLPVAEVQNVVLPAGAEPRSALEVRVALPGGDREITVTGIHFYRTEAERLAQAQVLADRYAGARDPVILAGDFNSERGDSVMTLLEQQFAIVDKDGSALTFPADAPRKEIDFVLLRPAAAFRVVGHTVVDERVASDHRPLVIALEL